MPLKTVTEYALNRGGFSAPASASSYYPAGNSETHIHLGVPTTAGGQIAPANTRWVTFISLKVNGTTVGRLEPDAQGNFHIDRIPLTRWQPGWRDQLTACLGDMIQR